MGESEPKKIQVFNRLKDFPLVAAIGTYAQTKFEEAKQSEMFGEFVVKAENILREVIEKLEPLTGKMEKHIAVVDDLAIKGLNKMEEYFPIIKQQPGEIKESLVAYAESMRNSEHLSTTFKTLLLLIVEGAKLFVEFIINLMKGTLVMELLVNTIDYLLPPLKDEEPYDTPSSVEKFKDYYAKLSKRFSYYYKNALTTSSEDESALAAWANLPFFTLPAALYSMVVMMNFELWVGFQKLLLHLIALTSQI